MRPRREKRTVEVTVKGELDDKSEIATKSRENNRTSDDAEASASDENNSESSVSEEEEGSVDGDEVEASNSTDPQKAWTIKWSKSSKPCWAQDKHGHWYEARIVDVIGEDDARRAQVTEENIQQKRGLKAKPGKHVDMIMTEGDWVRVHFQGWSQGHDEWMHFVRGGLVCTQDQNVCWCVRHPNGLRSPAQRSGAAAGTEQPSTVASSTGAQKRKRGRPRKNPPITTAVEESKAAASDKSSPQKQRIATEKEKDDVQSASKEKTEVKIVSKEKEHVKSALKEKDGVKSVPKEKEDVKSASKESGRASRRRNSNASVKAEEPALGEKVETDAKTVPPVSPSPEATAATTRALRTRSSSKVSLSSDKKKLNEEGTVEKAAEPVETVIENGSVPHSSVVPTEAQVPVSSEGEAVAEVTDLSDAAKGSTEEAKGNGTMNSTTHLPENLVQGKPQEEAGNLIPAADQTQTTDVSIPERQLNEENDEDKDVAEESGEGIDDEKQMPRVAGAVLMDPAKILKLDKDGYPAAAAPLMAYAKEQDWSVEKLLKSANVGTLNTACRWWFKGEKLLRPAVLHGAAKMVEWFEAKQEKRPERPVTVDISAATEFKRKMDEELGPSAQYQAELLRKQMLKKARLISPGEIPNEQSSAPVTSSRRSGALGENGLMNVKLIPSTGKWESSLCLAPNRACQRIGLFDSCEIATAASKKASAVIEEMMKEMRENSALQEKGSKCPVCNTLIQGDALRQCSLCPRRYHINCVPSPTLIVDRDPNADWICQVCEYELMKTAVSVAGSTTSAIVVSKPSFVHDSGSGSGSSVAAAALHLGAGASGTKVRKSTATSTPGHSKRGHGGAGGQVRFEDEIRFSSSHDGHTEWVGVPYITPPHRIAERKVYFSGFARVDNPDMQFMVLDHVLVGRRGSAFAENMEEEQKNSPDFFVGQIEALWEDRQTSERFMRIAWFFWPEETDHNIESFKHVGEGMEIMSSFESDVEHITRVITKTKVLSKAAFDEYQQNKLEEEARKKAKEEEEAKARRLQEEEEEKQRLVEEAQSAAAAAEAAAQTEEASTTMDTAEPVSQVVSAVTTTTAPSSSVSTAAAASTIAPSRPKHLRECARCGMWGFRTAAELGAHSGRFCGEDTPDALQKRRAEWGRDIATGDEVPTPATKDVPPKPRPVRATDMMQHPTSAPSKRDAIEGEDDDISIHPMVVQRAMERAAKGPFFARCHYHQRENRLDDVNHDTSGNNALQSSVLFATKDRPQTDYWSKMPVEGQLSCIQSLTFPEVKESDLRCGFCWTKIETTDICILCTECPGDLVMCIPCVRLGRQGKVGGEPSSPDEQEKFHRVSHAYKVRPATIDPTNPVTAPQVLAKLCGQLGLGQPRYELLEIARMATGQGTKRPRFRAGVFVSNLAAALCAEEFGLTMEQAEAQAAFTALRTFFGGTHRFAVSIARSKWSCWEAARLMDAMSVHGLAWETVAPIVGTKDATSCRLFFSEHLANPPASTSDVDGAVPLENVQSSAKSSSLVTILASAGSDGKPITDIAQEVIPKSLVEMAESDAKEWARKVRDWRKRRQQGRTGLLFAVVDGSIIRLPDSTAFIRQQSNECRFCSKPFISADKMRCVVCEDAYHVNCALKMDPAAGTTPRDEWYCPICLEDEKYAYEDSCWGASGKLLCAIADRLEQSSFSPSSTLADWEFNSLILAEATRMAQAIVRQQQSGGHGDTYSESADSRQGPKRPASSDRKRARADAEADDERKKLAKKLKESLEEVAKLKEENKALKLDLHKVAVERDQLKQKLESLSPPISQDSSSVADGAPMVQGLFFS